MSTPIASQTLLQLLGSLPSDQNGALSLSDVFVVAIGKLDQNSQLSMRTAGGTFTGDVTVSATLTVDRLVMNQSAIAFTANPTFDYLSGKTLIDFGLLTGTITISTSSRAAGRELSIRFHADASNRTLNFPAWIWLGGVAPTTLAAGKYAILSLHCWDTTDAGTTASWAVQS